MMRCCDNWHQFEPRYDECPREVGALNIKGCSAADLRDLLTYRVYVRDVCVRCGEVRERERARRG